MRIMKWFNLYPTVGSLADRGGSVLRPLGRKAPCGKGVGFDFCWSCRDMLVYYITGYGVVLVLVFLPRARARALVLTQVLDLVDDLLVPFLKTLRISRLKR